MSAVRSLAAISICKLFASLPLHERKVVCEEIVLRTNGYTYDVVDYMSKRELDLFVLHRMNGVHHIDYEFMQKQLQGFPAEYTIVADTTSRTVRVTSTTKETGVYKLSGDNLCPYNIWFLFREMGEYKVFVDGRPLVTTDDAPMQSNTL
jgi:hypothetical protein